MFGHPKGSRTLAIEPACDCKSFECFPPAPYRHFESKEHLLARLFEHGFQPCTRKFRKLPEAYKTDELIKRFYLMLENIISFASNNPDLYLFMFGSCPFDKACFQKPFRRQTRLMSCFATS